MSVSIEFEGWTDSKARRMVNTIYDTTLKVFKISDERNIPTYQATDILAEERIESIRNIVENIREIILFLTKKTSPSGLRIRIN